MQYNRALVKGAVKMTVNYSVGFAVSRLLAANTPTKNKTEEVEVKVAGFALGSLVAAQAVKHVDRQYDEVETAVIELNRKLRPFNN